jgi:ParB family chromosome partitioning protein
MVNEFGLTQDTVAEKVGRDRSSIANMLRLMTLPSEIQDLVESNHLSTGHAKVILGLVAPEAQIDLARRIVQGRLSVREAERLLQHQSEGRRHAKRTARPPARSDLEERLQKRLGTRVQIEKGRRGGKIIIQYFSPEELDGIVEKILDEAGSFS